MLKRILTSSKIDNKEDAYETVFELPLYLYHHTLCFCR